eukprot:SAG31_NODE_612_length_13548_cov_171.183285_2_plen_433_part_00
MKAYPMSLEPLWACGDCSASPQALRSTVYGKVLTQGSDNNFYVGTDRTANARNWQIMAATETVSSELQSLTGAIRSRAHLDAGYVQPEATCTHAVVLPTPQYKPQPNGSFTGLVSARVFREQTPAGMNGSASSRYFCYTLIAVNTRPYPFIATLAIENLGLPVGMQPRAGSSTTQLPFKRLFRGSCNAKDGSNQGLCDVNGTLYPNGSVTLTDMYDVQTTNVYQLGCDIELLRRPPTPGELCIGGTGRLPGGADCGFESVDLDRGMYMPSWAETMLLEFNTTDYRQYVDLDSADPYHGRHSARINAPNADLLLMPVQTSIDAGFRQGQGTGVYRVRFAARSSPAGVAVGAIFEQFAPHGSKRVGPPAAAKLSRAALTTTAWQVFEQLVKVRPVPNCSAPVSCEKIPLMIWARSPFHTGAFIGIDEISVTKQS